MVIIDGKNDLVACLPYVLFCGRVVVLPGLL